jgi:hypothetical protein
MGELFPQLTLGAFFMKSCTRSCGIAVRSALGLGLAAIAFLGSASVVSAQGYDFFQTGSGAYVDLSSMGLGQVNLQGVPIEPSTFGNTDTIMYRSNAVPSGGGNVSTVVYALYLQSTSPVTYKGQSADVYVTINNSNGGIPQSVLPQPDNLSGSSGNLNVDTGTSTFSSTLSVNADLIFVTHGGSPTNSSQILGSGAAPSVSMGTSGSTYSTSAPPNYPTATCYPAGGFYPIPKHTGPHPVKPGTKTSGGSSAPKSAAIGVISCPAPIQEQAQ